MVTLGAILGFSGLLIFRSEGFAGVFYRKLLLPARMKVEKS